MQQKAGGFTCVAMLVACILSVIGLRGTWWGQTVEGKFLSMSTAYDITISLWNIETEAKLGVDGLGSGSSSSEKSLDDLCENVNDQSSDNQREFCKHVVVIRVFSVLGFIAAAVSLFVATLLVTSLQFEFPWKSPPSSLLLLTNAIMAGFIVLFTLISIIIAAFMKEDGFSSNVSDVAEISSTDFGVKGSGFICNVLLLVVGVSALVCGLVSFKQAKRELPATQTNNGPTILGKMSNAVKGAQNV